MVVPISGASASGVELGYMSSQTPSLSRFHWILSEVNGIIQI